jgi:hypothetical protein
MVVLMVWSCGDCSTSKTSLPAYTTATGALASSVFCTVFIAALSLDCITRAISSVCFGTCFAAKRAISIQ